MCARAGSDTGSRCPVLTPEFPQKDGQSDRANTSECEVSNLGGCLFVLLLLLERAACAGCEFYSITQEDKNGKRSQLRSHCKSLPAGWRAASSHVSAGTPSWCEGRAGLSAWLQPGSPRCAPCPGQPGEGTMRGILRGPPGYSVSARISCSALGLGEPTTPIWSQVSSQLSLLFCFSPVEALSFTQAYFLPSHCFPKQKPSSREESHCKLRLSPACSTTLPRSGRGQGKSPEDRANITWLYLTLESPQKQPCWCPLRTKRLRRGLKRIQLFLKHVAPSELYLEKEDKKSLPSNKFGAARKNY